MEMPPTGIKSFSAEPELESADYSPQASSKPNIRKLQRANQDLSKRNHQLSKSVESLKKENEQLKAGKKSLGSRRKSSSSSRRSGRSLSEGGDEMDSVLTTSVQTMSEYEATNKLTAMENLVAERDREIAELKRHLNSSMCPTSLLSSDSHQQLENSGAQELDLHLAGGVVDNHQLSESSLINKENSELKSQVALLENELRHLQQQQRASREPSPEPSKSRKKFGFFRRSNRRQDSSGPAVSHSTEPSPKSSKKSLSRSSVSSVPLEASVSDNDLHSLSIGRRSTVSPPKGDMSLLQSHMRSALEERVTLERKLEELREELSKAEEKVETLTNECSAMKVTLQTVTKERDTALQENKRLGKAASPKRHRRQPSDHDQELHESLLKEIEKLRKENQMQSEEMAAARSKMHQMKRETQARENELRALCQRKQEEVEVLATELKIAYTQQVSSHMNSEDASKPYDPNSPPKWRRVTHDQSSPPRQQSQHSSIFANITGRRGSLDGTPPTPTSPQKQRKSSQGSAPSSPTKSRRSSSKEPPSPRKERASTGPTQIRDVSKESSPGRERSITHYSFQPKGSSPTKKQSSPGASPKRSVSFDSDPPHHSQPSPSTGQLLPTSKGQNDKNEAELKTNKESENTALQERALSRKNDQQTIIPSYNSTASSSVQTQGHTTNNQPASKSNAPLLSSQAVGPPPSAVIIKPKGMKHRVISVPRLSPISSASEVQSPTPSPPPPQTKAIPPVRKSSDVTLPLTTSTTKERKRSSDLGTFSPTSPNGSGKQGSPPPPQIKAIPPVRKSSDVTLPSTTSTTKERKRSSDLGTFSPTSPNGSGKQGSPPPPQIKAIPPVRKSSDMTLPSTTSTTKERKRSSDLGTFSPTSPNGSGKQGAAVNSLVQLFNQMVGSDNQPVSTSVAKAAFSAPTHVPTSTPAATTKQEPPPVETSSGHSKVDEKLPQKGSSQVVTKPATIHEPLPTPPGKTLAATAEPPKKTVLALRRSFEATKEKSAPPLSSVKSTRKTSLQEEHTSTPAPPPAVTKTLSPKSTVITDVVKEVHTPTAVTPIAISKPKPPPMASQKTTRPNGTVSPPSTTTSSSALQAPQSSDFSAPKSPQQKTAPASRHPPLTSSTSLTTPTTSLYTPKQPVTTKVPVPTSQTVKQPPGMVSQTSNGQPSKPQQVPTPISYATVPPPAQRNSMVKTGVVFRRGATVASIQGVNNDPPQQPAWKSKLTTPQNGLSEPPTTTLTATSSQSGKAGQRPLSLYVTGSGNSLSSFISKMQEKEGNRAVSPTAPTATTSPVATPVSNNPVTRSVTSHV